jgi:hypothetical protein
MVHGGKMDGGALRTWSRCVLASAAFCVGTGCQEPTTTVHGLVTLNGKPLEMREGMRGTVVFQPASRQGATLNGVIDTQGRYELSEGSRLGVTPSVYWVTVSASHLVPAQDGKAPVSGRRITPAKYASATDSGFRVEVVPGPNQVDLALISDSNADAPDAMKTPAMAGE